VKTSNLTILLLLVYSLPRERLSIRCLATMGRIQIQTQTDGRDL
jgi:hypothetical protein